MNCDQAFESLTDPRLRGSRQLQWHLDHCRRCREMQATLEPALRLLDAGHCDETVAAAEADWTADATAAFHQFDPLPDTSPAADLVRTRPASRGSERRSTRLSRGLRYLAAGGLGAALAWSISGWFGPDPVEAVGLPAETQTACLWSQPAEAEQLDQKAIVVSCVACHLQTPVRTAP